MSYTVEQINGCTKKIIFNFETLDLSTEIKNAVLAKQKTVSLKGFRKGKAPLDMVQKMYGPQIEHDALNRFINNQFIEAIEKEDIRVVGYPTFENMNYESGKSVSFDALVEIFPSVEVKDMSGLSFKRDKVEVNSDDVEAIKKNYLNSKAEMKEITDTNVTLDKGMFAVMNFQGEKADGEKPENMKGEDFLLEIGSGQFIPGFEEGMVGMKKGETKVIELTFPSDYHAEDLKDAKVKFEVELLEIKSKEYPEFSDELAKEFGFESVADFDEKNMKSMEMQKNRAADEKLHQEILEKLVEENTFEIPKAMIHQQEDYLKQDLTRNLKAQGFTDEMCEEYFNKWHDDLHTKAEFQVKSGLILDTLAKKFNVETTEADLDKKIAETAEGTGADIEQIKKYYTSNEQIKKNMMYAIREEKTFEKIKETVKIG
ncbi:MAG: trigger factor [Deltaproteobacteria bacterium]|nr:MAG: trigger factor [Deltaproteobacteria bacterium]